MASSGFVGFGVDQPGYLPPAARGRIAEDGFVSEVVARHTMVKDGHRVEYLTFRLTG